MTRAVPEDVIEILGDHYDGITSLLPFIKTAASLVRKIQTANITLGVLTSDDLEIIEQWLAAHFYGHADQFSASRRTGRASAEFQGKTAMVFNSTQYGQAALGLDTTGTLADIQKNVEMGKQRASMVWLGTRYKNDNSQRTEDQ